MTKTGVFGIYANRVQAEVAVEQMRKDGFPDDDISMLSPRHEGSKDFVFELDNKALEGTSAGAAFGSVLGGALGWLVGIGTLAIPVLDPYIGREPFLSLVSGVALGATLGGLTGALTGSGISAYETVLYRGRIKEGSILLSVHSEDPDRTRKAKTILDGTGAADIAWACGSETVYANADQPGVRAQRAQSTSADVGRRVLLTGDPTAKAGGS